MGSVMPFPAPRRAIPALSLVASNPGLPPLRDPRALPATGGRRGKYALGDLARPLGLLDRPVRHIVDTLRALHRHEGLPLPHSPRIVNGRPLAGADTICKAALWDAGEVDAWLDHRNPPPPAVAAARTHALRARLARRAEALVA